MATTQTSLFEEPGIHEVQFVADPCDSLNLGQFIEQYGRPPFIGDARKPWAYRGWLMYYVQHQSAPWQAVRDRWDYWYRTNLAGHVLDEPIPQITFEAQCSSMSAGFKAFDKWVDIVDRFGGGWSSASLLINWLAWGLAVANEPEKALSEECNEALYQGVNLEPWLMHPADYIGAWIAEHKGRWNPTGFYPTPHHIVEMMVRMMAGEDDWRCKTVMEPCLGTGRMLLHASNYSLRLHGMDIDQTVLTAALVNGALYAPWMVRPFPEEIFA